jgi:hypothetical protein
MPDGQLRNLLIYLTVLKIYIQEKKTISILSRYHCEDVFYDVIMTGVVQHQCFFLIVQCLRQNAFWLLFDKKVISKMIKNQVFAR